MSRIGRAPIAVPAGVTVTIADGNVVTVKGPLGELKFRGSSDMVQIDGVWYLTNYSIPLYEQE